MAIKYKNIVIYTIFIVFQMLVCLFYANQKQSFYCDEPWSYGLANSRDYAFIDRLATLRVSKDGWVTQDFYNNFVNVDKDNPFSYYPAYHNQELDVHPPFYYFLLHTASLFTDHFSKWPGIILNLIILLFFDFVFFYVAKKVFKDKIQAILALALFSLSSAGLSSILYTRMYFLLSFWVLCYLAIHVHIITNKKISRLDFAMLFLCVVFAGLTHYYFYVFAFFVSFAFGISLLIKRKIYDAFLYGSSLLGGFLFNINFFTATVVHVFLRNRGAEVLEKIENNQASWIDKFIKWINDYLFAGYLYAIIIAFTLASLYWLVVAKNKPQKILKIIKEKPFLKENNVLMMFVIYLFLTANCFIIKFSYSVHRFVFPTYPLLAIITVFLFGLIYKLIGIKKEIRNFISAFIVCSLVILSVEKRNIDYLYPEYPDAVEAMKETAGYDILIYYNILNAEEYYTSFQVRMIYDEYLLFDENDVRYLKAYLGHRKTKDPLVIAIPRFKKNKHKLLSEIYKKIEAKGLYKLVHPYRGYDYFVIE